MSKERPILFSAPMVRALLARTKTQTRRIMKPQPTSPKFRKSDAKDEGREYWVDYTPARPMPSNGTGDSYVLSPLPVRVFCPYGQPGDRLWVRETWTDGYSYDGQRHFAYRADGIDLHPSRKWKPSIHMPRVASRLALEITGVRVERLQEISMVDAIAEGCDWAAPKFYGNDPDPEDREDPREVGYPSVSPAHGFQVDNYRRLWESINGPGSWGANPWVWVVSFKPLPPDRSGEG